MRHTLDDPNAHPPEPGVTKTRRAPPRNGAGATALTPQPQPERPGFWSTPLTQGLSKNSNRPSSAAWIAILAPPLPIPSTQWFPPYRPLGLARTEARIPANPDPDPSP